MNVLISHPTREPRDVITQLPIRQGASRIALIDLYQRLAIVAEAQQVLGKVQCGVRKPLAPGQGHGVITDRLAGVALNLGEIPNRSPESRRLIQ